VGWTVLPGDTTSRLERWHWNDRPVVLTIVVLAAIGVAALFIGLWRRAPLTAPLAGAADVAFERHALEQSLRRRIEALDGVARAKVRTNTSELVARVDTRRRYEPDALKARIDAQLADSMATQHVNLRREVRLRYRGGER
jgi:hypothetical protein